MTQSLIEWTGETWNPTTGCTKVSPGCDHCYAELMALRLQSMEVKDYKNGFELTLHPGRLKEPIGKKKPRVYFVNSMSDLFHSEVSLDFLDAIFDTIKKTPQHTYQILTKRPNRMRGYFANPHRSMPKNVWLGTTVENKKQGIPRIEVLREIKCGVRFLSCEPLLEDLGRVDLTGIHWVIVGGESGLKARAMQASWAENIQKQCQQQKVAFFFKQWGAWGSDGVKRSKKDNGRVLSGRKWEEYPAPPVHLEDCFNLPNG